jgi:hypothetical protein
MGGTRAKPLIACANKACGYKRAVGDGGPASLAEPVETQPTAAI